MFMLKSRIMVKQLLLVVGVLLSGCMSNQDVERMERAYGSPMDCNGDLQVTQEITIYDESKKTEPEKIESRCHLKNNVPKSEYDKKLERQIKEYK